MSKSVLARPSATRAQGWVCSPSKLTGSPSNWFISSPILSFTVPLSLTHYHPRVVHGGTVSPFATSRPTVTLALEPIDFVATPSLIIPLLSPLRWSSQLPPRTVRSSHQPYTRAVSQHPYTPVSTCRCVSPVHLVSLAHLLSDSRLIPCSTRLATRKAIR
jgi:hypothetical protein